MAIAFTYDESLNKVQVTGGTSGTPADFDDFVTADRAGTAELTPEDSPVAFTQVSALSLTYAVRPVENIALTLTFTISGSAGLGAGDTIDISGDDWEGNNQTESIVIAAGDGAYASTKKYSTIDAAGITFTDNAGGGFSGNLQVTQPQWGVVWDYGNNVFQQDCLFQVGDGGVSTYFNQKESVWIFNKPAYMIANQGKDIDILSNASLVIGQVDDVGNKLTSKGCLLHFIPSISYYSNLTVASGGTMYFYDSSFYGPGSKDTQLIWNDGCAGRVWNSILSNRVHFSKVYDTDIYNVIVNYGPYGIRRPYSDSTINRLFVQQVSSAVYFQSQSQGSIANLYIRGSVSQAFQMYAINSTWCEVIDIDLDTWEINWISTTNGKLYRRNTVNLHIVDKDGVAIQGVDVRCESSDTSDYDTEEFDEVTTDANGDIAQQTVTRGYCNENNNNLDTNLTVDYTPHRFTLSKAGYETLVIENVTVDNPINWHLELQSIKHPPAVWEMGNV